MNRFIGNALRQGNAQKAIHEIDIGNPPLRMVGHTGFVRLAGGGRCKRCRQVFATLLQNSMCAGCAANEDQPPTGPLGPLVGTR